VIVTPNLQCYSPPHRHKNASKMLTYIAQAIIIGFLHIMLSGILQLAYFLPINSYTYILLPMLVSS
jgi:hypothetical protein